jgi:hypothetical protein
VIDCGADRFVCSIPKLAGVAGAVVSEEHNSVFTCNRGENNVGIFSPEDDAGVGKVPVGVRPNGLAYVLRNGLQQAANVGDPAVPGSQTASIVDVPRRERIADVAVPGRTRLAVYHLG